MENSSTGLYWLQCPHQCILTPSTTVSGCATFRPRGFPLFVSFRGLGGGVFSATIFFTSSGLAGASLLSKAWRFLCPLFISEWHCRQKGW